VHSRDCTFTSVRVFDLSPLRNIQGAGPRLFDIPDKFGLVHSIGLGGAVVVSLLRRPEF